MKRLLIAHDLKPLMMSVMNFLHRAEIAVLTAATSDDILKMHLEQGAHLVVTRPDLPGLACEALVHTIRRGEAMRAVSIILLYNEDPSHAERARKCGVNAVFALTVDPALFAGKVQELLDVAPRRYYRVVLNMAVDGKFNDRPLICSSENISENGLLIRTKEKLVLGDRIACSLTLPDGKRISAGGEVIRIARNQPGEDFNRYGIRFVSIPSEAEAAIASFVEREKRKHT